MEKLFWSQFGMPKHQLLLNEQMARWAKLHGISGSAMKDVIVRLWPTEPIPNSYFSLVQRLVDAVPRIDAVKRSACIEGARMAFCPFQDILGEDEGHQRCSEESPSRVRTITHPNIISRMS